MSDSDDDVIVLDHSPPPKTTTNATATARDRRRGGTAKPSEDDDHRLPLASEWAFLDSDSDAAPPRGGSRRRKSQPRKRQDKNDEDAEEDAAAAAAPPPAPRRRGRPPKNKAPTPLARKSPTKPKAKKPPTAAIVADNSDSDFEDVIMAPPLAPTMPMPMARPRHRHLFSDALSLSELQAQERELARFKLQHLKDAPAPSSMIKTKVLTPSPPKKAAANGRGERKPVLATTLARKHREASSSEEDDEEEETKEETPMRRPARAAVAAAASPVINSGRGAKRRLVDSSEEDESEQDEPESDTNGVQERGRARESRSRAAVATSPLTKKSPSKPHVPKTAAAKRLSKVCKKTVVTRASPVRREQMERRLRNEVERLVADVPKATPSRRSSGGGGSALTDWLSLSELQAQEREWKRLEREKKVTVVVDDDEEEVEEEEEEPVPVAPRKIERTTTKKVTATAVTRETRSSKATSYSVTSGESVSVSVTRETRATRATRNLRSDSTASNDSSISLIEVVELMEEEDDDENGRKRQDDDDDDFVPVKPKSVTTAKGKGKPSGSRKPKNQHQPVLNAKPTKTLSAIAMTHLPITSGGVKIPAELEVPADIFLKPRTAAQSVPHTTAWRGLLIANPPPNLLQLDYPSSLPFESTMDRPLSDFDKTGDLQTRCQIVASFGKTKQFLLTADPSPALSQEAMDERVAGLLEKWLPQIRYCYEKKTAAVIREERAKIGTYLDQLDTQRSWLLRAPRGTWKHEYLNIAAADQMITKELKVSTSVSPLEKKQSLGYVIGRGEFLTEKSIVAERAVQLTKLLPLSRSTTYVGVKNSVRVEDDPILRFVPYFGDNDSGDAIDVSHYESVKREKEAAKSSSGIEHEIHEYMLRLVVAECGDSETVFNALKRVASFTQPYTEYCEIKKMYDSRRVAAKRMEETRTIMKAKGESDDPMEATKIALVKLTAKLPPITAPLQPSTRRPLVERLASQWTFFETHLLPPSHGRSEFKRMLGLRNTNDYADLSETYRDLFCRMCYKYDCHEHGIEHPMPTRRVDPIYPSTRYAPVTLKTQEVRHPKDDMKIEEEEKSAVEDRDVSVDNDAETSEATCVDKDEESSKMVAGAEDELPQQTDQELETPSETNESIENQEEDDESVDDAAEVASTGRRRSSRSQTRASTLATLSLESQQLQGQRGRAQRARPKATPIQPKEDESEYLDDSHILLTKSMMKTFLSDDGCCGPSCWKAHVDDETKESDSFMEPDELVKAKLSPPELLVLQKLRYTVGDNPCMIASIMDSLTCEDVHTFLGRHRRQKPSDPDGCFSPDVSAKKNRKRGRATTALPGNNRELLKRTRHQRLKDTSSANHEYEPCNHEGICDFAVGCSCMKRDHMCEKACSCSRDCPNRFQGCRCSLGNCRTNQCPCFVAMRECNPDLCGTCGAADIPVLIYSADLCRLTSVDLGVCCNMNVQRGLHKKIGVSFSKTHGWGAFALEPILKGEFIYEYTGAIVSHDEAERRGSIYDKMKISFLFDLNEDSVVDAVRKGNKSKFSNHANVGQKCHARIMRIGGEHRISIWAAADIQRGEEVFFNYGYHGESAPVWSQIRITGASKREAEPSTPPARGCGREDPSTN